jgi:hypothetical protein
MSIIISRFRTFTRGIVLAPFCLFFLVSIAQAQLVFDKPKTDPPLDNPYTIGVARSKVVQDIAEVLKTCQVPLDEEQSRKPEGKFVTKHLVFSKGITVRTDLEHISNPSASETRNWTRARYFLEIVVLPLDEKRSQLQVTAHIQGMVNDFTGSRWIDVPTNGRLEDEVLRGLAGRILGIDLSLNKKGTRRIFNCEY